MGTITKSGIYYANVGDDKGFLITVSATSDHIANIEVIGRQFSALVEARTKMSASFNQITLERGSTATNGTLVDVSDNENCKFYILGSSAYRTFLFNVAMQEGTTITVAKLSAMPS